MTVVLIMKYHPDDWASKELLVRFATVAHRGGTSAAVLRAGIWWALPATDLSVLFAQTAVENWLGLAGEALLDAVPVLPLPAPGKVICCGLNYGGHIAETGRERPEHPTLFTKFPDSLIGPSDDIELPGGLDIDWEAELAVVVGKPLRRAHPDEARASIAGYTVANDISIRDWQHRTLQWFQGKAWERSSPLGPVLVTAEELNPFAGVDVICRVNGEEVQRGNTNTLIFDCAALLAYISTFTTLRAGDVVLTGTPDGIGAARTPKWFLSNGDIVETQIEGLGTMRNTVRVIDIQAGRPAMTRSSNEA